MLKFSMFHFLLSRVPLVWVSLFLPRLSKSKLKRRRIGLASAAALLAASGLAQTGLAGTVNYDSKFVSDLLSTSLTASDFQRLTCLQAFAAYDSVATSYSSPSASTCARATADPQFYSTTTPRFYKFQACSSNASQYIIFGNLLAQTGDVSPQAKTVWQSDDPSAPTPDLTLSACSTAPSFTYPPGFVAAASSTRTLSIARFGGRLGDSVPQDSSRPTYSVNGLGMNLVATGSANSAPTLTVPYTQQGTAVYNTDYGIDDNSQTGQTTGTSMTLLNNSAGNGGTGVYIPITYNPNNHAALSLQWLFTPPAGFVFLGQPTWYGSINPLTRPSVSITDPTTTLTPGASNQFFTLTRSGAATTSDLTVNYAIAGTAANGTDYGYLSGVATIPADSSSLKIPIYAPSPTSAQPAKTVQLTVTPSTDATGYLAAASPSNQLTLNIPAYTPSTVSFAQASGGGTLTPGTPQTITVSRAGGDNSQPLTIPYTTGGTATGGSDYNALPGSVTIPAGATSATIPVSAIQQTGSTAVPAKTLTVTPGTGSGYTSDGSLANYNIPAYTPTSVSVSSPANGGAIADGGTAPFTVTRTGDTSQPLTIPYTTGGTAMPGTDYGQLPGSITIPAGATSATQTISTPPGSQHGTTANPSKTITITPQAGTGYSVDSTNGTATYNTAAYSPIAVSAAAGSGGSTIPQGTTGSFTLTRTGDTTKAMSVAYTLGGTAVNGTDYNQLPGSATIPAGQTSVMVPVTVPVNQSSTAIAAKDIQVTVANGQYYVADATTPSTDLTIPAYAPSMVDFGSGSQGGTLTPGGTSDGFTVTRTGPTTAPLTVGYTVGGSATPGQDYGQLPGSVTIPAGATSATVPLKAFPQSGTAAIPQKDVQISLASGSGYAPSSTTPADYKIPAYSPNANSNPAVTVSVPTGQDTILQPGTSTDGFTVTRSGATTSPLSVNYTVGGTGTSGTDYAPLSGTVTIPAGATSATVPINVPTGANPGKTVAIGVTPGTGYDQGTNSTVTYTIGSKPIGDPGPPSTVSLGFDPAIPAFVVTRAGGDTTQPLTVPVNFGGSGVPGVDYSQLPTSVTFGAGKTTAQVPVKLLPTATTGDTITASIPDGSGYTVGSGNGTAFTVPAGYNDGSGSTTATTGSTSKGSSGGLGSASGFLAGAGGLGSIALGTGAIGSAGVAAAGAGSALAVPGLLAGAAFGAIPQSCSVTGETPSALVKLIPQLKDGQPNWSAITFKGLPAPSEAGSVKFGNSTRDWKAGQPVSDIVHVGDTDGSFNLHCLGLSKLANLGQLGMAAKPLSALNLVADTTVQGLSKTLYLRSKKIGDVKGMAQWLAAKAGGSVTADQLAGMSFADALKANPALGKLPMGNLPLNQLPGYGDILLGDIPNWSSQSVSQVLGLANVPFSQFPTQPKPLSAFSK